MAISHDQCIADLNTMVTQLNSQVASANQLISQLKKQVNDLQNQLLTPTLTTDEIEPFISAVNNQAATLITS